jgi:hypothetical protein
LLSTEMVMIGTEMVMIAAAEHKNSQFAQAKCLSRLEFLASECLLASKALKLASYGTGIPGTTGSRALLVRDGWHVLAPLLGHADKGPDSTGTACAGGAHAREPNTRAGPDRSGPRAAAAGATRPGYPDHSCAGSLGTPAHASCESQCIAHAGDTRCPVASHKNGQLSRHLKPLPGCRES